jgi:uncharacterized protein with HEPN domain
MSKDPKEYLRHILEECKFIDSYCKNIKKDEFVNDEVLKRAVTRSIGIIGEATKKVPDDFKEIWKGVEWKSMAGMRDRLIHDYFGINYSIVWDVVKNKIPILITEIEQLIESE